VDVKVCLKEVHELVLNKVKITAVSFDDGHTVAQNM
jgi:hypothetical protein